MVKSRDGANSRSKREIERYEEAPDPRYLDIVLDAGNSAVKALRLGDAQNGVYFPHAVYAEAPGQYDARIASYANQPNVFWDTVAFSSMMQPASVGGYIVGGQAEQLGRVTNLSGVKKYRAGHMDILMLAALQQIAPDGHDAVRVAIAYPSGTAAHIDDVKRCLYENTIPPIRLSSGKMSKAKVHRIRRWDGIVVEYNIKGVTAWEEPIGGLFRFFTRPYAEYNQYDIRVGDQMLLVDIGGKISSMSPVRVVSGERFEVLTASSRSFDIGINDVKRALESELRLFDPQTFSVRRVPVDIIEEALRTGGAPRVRGKVTDYSIPVNNAVNQLLRQLSMVFNNDFDGGLDIAHVVCSGGGSGLLFDVMCRDVFPDHGSVCLSDERDKIQFANARGGAYSFALFLSQGGAA